jgi:hypothetical protein
MFVYINPLPSNQIAIAKEKTNGRNQKVLQETLKEIVCKAIFEEGNAASLAVTFCRQAWRKEDCSKTQRCEAQACEAELSTPADHCTQGSIHSPQQHDSRRRPAPERDQPRRRTGPRHCRIHWFFGLRHDARASR